MANDIVPLKDARGFPQIPIAIVSKIACTDFEVYRKLLGGKCKKTQTGQTGKALNQVLRFYVAYVKIFPVYCGERYLHSGDNYNVDMRSNDALNASSETYTSNGGLGR